MDDRESKLRAEFTELDRQLQDPGIFSDPKYPKLARRRSELEDMVALFDKRAKLLNDKRQAEEMMAEYGGESGSSEFVDMAQSELSFIVPELEATEKAIIEALTPQDPNNDRDVIMEIRAAAGGDESSLFAGELYATPAPDQNQDGLPTSEYGFRIFRSLGD